MTDKAEDQNKHELVIIGAGPAALSAAVYTTREDIDTGIVLGCGHPMGPLTLLDMIGLDTIYSITGIMFDEFKDPKYAAPPLLKQMVKAGFYGRKSGKGFYDYR